jgi:hypothetical protein
MKVGFVVSPIIRGYTLRSFVETHSPENRYSDVADWLQLSPLVEVQKNLRLLRRDVKAAAESTTEQDRLADVLRSETGQPVQAWDEADVLAFIAASSASAGRHAIEVLKQVFRDRMGNLQ